MLEFQSLKSPLYERVLSVLHVDAIKVIALGDDEVEPEDVPAEELTEDYVLLQVSLSLTLKGLLLYTGGVLFHVECCII